MMKSILTLCSLFTLSCLINAVFSQSIDGTRLYKIIRESMNSKFTFAPPQETIFARLRSASSSSTEEQLNSLKNKETTQMKVRHPWDSEEDHYFRWASNNRRPMEPIPGRRRAVGTTPIAFPGGRISGGIWRSGIVG